MNRHGEFLKADISSASPSSEQITSTYTYHHCFYHLNEMEVCVINTYTKLFSKACSKRRATAVPN